jgi:hypothetical protein
MAIAREATTLVLLWVLWVVVVVGCCGVVVVVVVVVVVAAVLVLLFTRRARSCSRFLTRTATGADSPPEGSLAHTCRELGDPWTSW